MSVRYEVRQRVKTVTGARMETVAWWPVDHAERPALLWFDSLQKNHPGEYFEVVKMTEECIEHTSGARP